MADLGSQIELIDDRFDVLAKAIEVGLEIGFQNLAIIGRGIDKLFQGPWGSIVENIAGRIFQPFRVKISKTGVVSLKLNFLHNSIFGRLQQAVKAP